jgi:hypothetical protein
LTADCLHLFAIINLRQQAGVTDNNVKNRFESLCNEKSKVINVSESTLAKPAPDLPMRVELLGNSLIF